MSTLRERADIITRMIEGLSSAAVMTEAQKWTAEQIELGLLASRNEALEEAAKHLYQREKDLEKCEGNTYLQRCECNVQARAIQELKHAEQASDSCDKK